MTCDQQILTAHTEGTGQMKTATHVCHTFAAMSLAVTAMGFAPVHASITDTADPLQEVSIKQNTSEYVTVAANRTSKRRVRAAKPRRLQVKAVRLRKQKQPSSIAPTNPTPGPSFIADSFSFAVEKEMEPNDAPPCANPLAHAPGC